MEGDFSDKANELRDFFLLLNCTLHNYKLDSITQKKIAFLRVML